MKWAVLAARLFVGGMFVVFGLNGFLRFVDIPTPPEPARTYIGMMVESKYLYAVKVLEVAAGLLLLVGRFVPLGLTVLTPISLNILFYEIFLMHGGGPGFLLVPLCGFLIWAYWPYFRPLLTPTARPAV